MSSFLTKVVANAIGFGIVWTGVLMFNHFRTRPVQNHLLEPDQKPKTQSGDAVKDNTVRVHERWYYPPDIANDLKDVDLPFRVKEEVFATAWEYTRCVIPEYTNWSRYVAFMRIIVMGILAEFRGSLMDVANDDNVVGYSLTQILDTLCGGTAG